MTHLSYLTCVNIAEGKAKTVLYQPIEVQWHFLYQLTGSSLVQVMAWCLTAPSHYSNQWWIIFNWTLRKNIRVIIIKNYLSRKCIWKYCLESAAKFHSGLNVLTKCDNKENIHFPQNLLKHNNIDGFVQDCSISIANALEILQPCT